MSELVFNNEGSKGRINGVVFCYTKLQDGDYKYQSKTEKEYSVDCVVDKATAKAYKKAFPKNGYKEHDNEDFEKIFKIKPPFEEEDEQFVIKLKTNAQMKADVPSQGIKVGDRVPYKWNTRPKVFVPAEDGNGVKDITMTTLISNGSSGSVAFNIIENSYGKFPQLTGMLVENLIEYQQEGGGDSDFGAVVGGLNPGDGDAQQVAKEPEDQEGQQKENNKQQEEGNDFPDGDVIDVPF